TSTAPRTGTLTIAGQTVTITQRGVPSGLQLVSGNNQITAPSQPFGAPLVVQYLDAQGQPAPGVPVAFAITSGTASISTSPVITNANGQATITVTAGSSRGALTITASAGGQSVIFQLAVGAQ